MMRSYLSPLLLGCAVSGALSACTSSGDQPAGPSNPSPIVTPGGGDGGIGPSSANSDAGGVAAAGNDASSPRGSDAALPDIERSTRSSLQWKRFAALQADLSQALDLPKDKLCNEFGTEPCIDKVHLLPLGGHNPFTTGLLEPVADTLVTTGSVMERVVLSACLAKIEQDRAAGKQASVFTLDLSGAAPAPDAPETRTLISTLYRRFLARDVADDELAIVADLARDAAGKPVSATTFAATACMTVGTTTEFLFF